ncbi:MAG TPA: glycoside hydrolase family 38 C-terminal domain-containing protein [Verrucomicrobiae bacterium]|nr:glycoside hydrolase family 38 C-terminal domain-containing protein [Verrucomicrobiae bacterium]
MSVGRLMSTVGVFLAMAGVTPGATPPDLAVCVTVENPVQRPGAYCVLHLQIPGGDPFNRYVIQDGDALEYDALIAPSTPLTGGGIDLQFTDLGWLSVVMTRQTPDLAAGATRSWISATGRWQHIRIPLSVAAERRIDRCCLRLVDDAPGSYQVLLDNIIISHADRAPLVFFDNQHQVAVGLQEASGFRMPHPVVFDKVLLPQDASLPDIMQRLSKTSLELPRLAAEFAGLNLLQEDFAATGEPTNFPVIIEQLSHYSWRKLFAELRPREFARQIDATLVTAEPLRAYTKRYTVDAVAYAHLDFVWLWSWPFTLRAAHDTFRQMLAFMDEYPQFTFTYTSPALFEALEREDPEMFAQIQRRAREGRWEMAGSRWCEADPNLISEESHARHFLQAQRYNQEKFGTRTTVCYEPDIFGHLPTMPQLLRKSGVLYYVSQHLPADPSTFWWKGPDGSRVLVYSAHKYSDTLDENLLNFCLTPNQRRAGHTDSLIVYGVGNHGGGPTRDQIENAVWLDKMPDFPSVKFSTLGRFMETISQQAPTATALVRQGDIQLDYRGTYTTHAEIKRLNRACENTLITAESFDAISQILGLQTRTNQFNDLWRSVLWAHHHDTISGTTIHDSSLYADRQLGLVLSNATFALARSLSNIVAAVDTIGPTPHARVVFNPVAWPVIAPVRVPLPDTRQQWEWIDTTGRASFVQLDPASSNSPMGVAVLPPLPGLGYQVGWLQPRPSVKDDDLQKNPGRLVARNQHLELEISPQSGNITRLTHLASTTEWVQASSPSVRLRVDYEAPHDWSAWEFGPVARTEWLDDAKSVTCIESGPVRTVFRARYQFGHSSIDKDIILYHDLSRVDIAIHVDWQEHGSAIAPTPWLRLEFPTTATVNHATYMIPFGEIERPADDAEYPATYGIGINCQHGSVCLVSDSKNGFSANTNTIRVSLLRTPNYPDPESDVGPHEMAFALEISAEPWAQAAMGRRGMEFNRHPIVVSANPHKGSLPVEQSFFSVEPSTVLVTALKTAYDTPGNLIVRLYQSATNLCVARLSTTLRSNSWSETDLIERPLTNAPPVDPLRLPVGAWDIRTYQLTPKQ